MKRDDWMLGGLNIGAFDIYDEVDALMTARRFFVYSIGASKGL
mgnify:CR=1 FL=1